MIIDSHVHAGRAGGLTASYTTYEDIRVSIERMDACGIEGAIVLPIDTTREADEGTARVVSEHAGRLWGYCKVDQARDAGSVRERLRYAAEELGLVGIKLHGPPNREIMDACEEFSLPVLVDPQHRPWGLQWAAGAYPKVSVIIAHLGSFLSRSDEAHQQSVWMARKFPNVFLDTSSVMIFSWLAEAVRDCGAGKLVFGSDGPGIHCGPELEKVRCLNLAPEEEAGVLGGTVARLAGLDV